MKAPGNFYSAIFFAVLWSATPLQSFSQTETVSTSLCGQTGPGTPCPGNANVQLYDFAFNITSGCPSFTSIVGWTTSGTYTAADITGFTLYATTFCAFNTGTPLQTIPAAGPGAHTFSFVNPLPCAAAQKYFWICTTFSAGAVTGHTITVNLITAGMYTVTGTLTYGGNSAGGTQTICNPAPVGLISFAGNCIDGKNVLDWSTATETNNDFFTLERTYDGNNFSVVSTVDGAGNSDMPLHYSATDEIPAADITYYRLKQTDYNGQFEYVGGMVAVRNENSKEIFCYPNSDKSKIIIANLSGETSYSIYNSVGQLIGRGTLSKNENEIDIASFNPGFYLLELQGENEVVKKFVK